ncbi:MAG: PhnD/SsuA/transferrin family substrate-binding protein [Synechococcales bacterium]|nr:PhnD/SsuA/transferrin family substrate-binding protein [Synechococcales bacterium]
MKKSFILSKLAVAIGSGVLLPALALNSCSQRPSPASSPPSEDALSANPTEVPMGDRPPQTPLSQTAPAPASDIQPLRLGVLAIDSALSVHARYKPLADYLTEATGYQFELVSLDQESQFTAVEQGTIDFATNNSLAAVQVHRLYDTEFLVTHSRPETGVEFSALIVVKDSSSIRTLADLKGKRVACVDFETAAAGCLFQVYHLRQAGINPFKDFGEFLENPSQDSIVLAVLNGSIDAGFIRTGQLEKMMKTGLLNSTDGLRVLEPMDDDFFYTHTTATYPEWPIAAVKGTDPAVVEAVRQALLNIPPDHPALTAANVTEFVPAVDYQSIDDLIETLQLLSWDAE